MKTERQIGICKAIERSGFVLLHGVNSYPTSFIISPDGEFLAYATGALSLDGFNQFFDYSMFQFCIFGGIFLIFGFEKYYVCL